jgi:hypothetical protein
VAAILPAPVAINSKHLATVQASEIIDRFALYPVKVRIPPDISALITAEAPFLLLGNLMNLSAAVLAPSCLAAAWCKRFDHRIPVDVMSATERLYCVQRYAERLGNLTVAVSGCTEFYDLHFLIFSHSNSSPLRDKREYPPTIYRKT